MKERIVQTTILLRRGTLAAFTENNPLLYYGEPSFVVDVNKIKVGDGVRYWNDLPYLYNDGSINFYSYYSDLPDVGEEGNAYYVKETNELYTWNSDSAKFVAMFEEQFQTILQELNSLPRNIEDLGQEEYVIFDCGNSETNI